MSDTPGKELALYVPVGEGGRISGLDRRLLEMAAAKKTPEQMHEALGYPEWATPAKLAQRVREILKSQTWLSVVEQKALLVLDLVRLRDKLFEIIDDGETRVTRHGDVVDVSAGPGYFNAFVRLLREWKSLIDEMSADVETERGMIQQGHAVVMMEAITVMFDRFLGRLETFFKDHGRLPSRVEMNDIMEEVIPLGFQSLEKRTAA